MIVPIVSKCQITVICVVCIYTDICFYKVTINRKTIYYFSLNTVIVKDFNSIAYFKMALRNIPAIKGF